jgi:hypothetical protein
MSKGERPRALRSLQKSFATRWPPGRGDFWILKIAYAPSDKNLSKNGSDIKGVAFLTETVFEKKFSGAGEDSAVGASASA